MVNVPSEWTGWVEFDVGQEPGTVDGPSPWTGWQEFTVGADQAVYGPSEWTGWVEFQVEEPLFGPSEWTAWQEFTVGPDPDVSLDPGVYVVTPAGLAPLRHAIEL